MRKIDGDDVTYWLTIALAVFWVWRADQVDDHKALFLLFGAAYLIIHAHGRRILAEIKKRND